MATERAVNLLNAVSGMLVKAQAIQGFSEPEIRRAMAYLASANPELVKWLLHEMPRICQGSCDGD